MTKECSFITLIEDIFQSFSAEKNDVFSLNHHRISRKSLTLMKCQMKKTNRTFDWYFAEKTLRLPSSFIFFKTKLRLPKKRSNCF